MQDWIADSKGKARMNVKLFTDALFELADVWCDSMEAADYVDVLKTLHTQVGGLCSLQENPFSITPHAGVRSWPYLCGPTLRTLHSQLNFSDFICCSICWIVQHHLEIFLNSVFGCQGRSTNLCRVLLYLQIQEKANAQDSVAPGMLALSGTENTPNPLKPAPFNASPLVSNRKNRTMAGSPSPKKVRG